VLLSNGELVSHLLERQVPALVQWQGPVLDNRDPEALHQMRVAMRRLRVTLQQFAPLLQLPPQLQQRRLAKTARRLGLARDLDVLRARLHERLLPRLPAQELALLKPVLKQLRRERLQAQEQVVEQLKGGAYLGWLAQMQRWQRQPTFTPLAQQPLADALVQWQLGWLAELYLHPAWNLEEWTKDCQREQLHDLRKQIKLARYQLDNCKPLLGRRCCRQLGQFKQMQELLGELNDLQVLQQAIADQLQGSLTLAADLPVLAGLLQQQQAQCWQDWRLCAVSQGRLATGQQLLGGLRHDRRRALLQRHARLMCSALQQGVFCDWRAQLPAR